VHVGERAGDQPVDLFGHCAVVRAQSGLDVDNRDARIVRRLCACRHGVGVTLHDHDPRRVVGEMVGEGLDGSSDLRPTGFPTDAGENDVGLPDPELLEESAGEFAIVMLAGVDDSRPVTEFADHGSELDDLGTSTEHQSNIVRGHHGAFRWSSAPIVTTLSTGRVAQIAAACAWS
jgi:hypothetical protein